MNPGDGDLTWSVFGLRFPKPTQEGAPKKPAVGHTWTARKALDLRGPRPELRRACWNLRPSRRAPDLVEALGDVWRRLEDLGWLPREKITPFAYFEGLALK